MERSQLEEIVACLPRGRTLFHYFKDRFALLLLEFAVGQGRSIRALRESPLAPLLRKPLVKRLLARCGSSRVTALDCQSLWPGPTYAYRLTLGRWPIVGEKWQRG